MKYCSNDACPDLQRYGFRSEYQADLEACPKCDQVLSDGPAPDRLTETKWVDQVCVATFTHPTSAHVARARLEAAGIPAIVQDEHLSGMQWLYSQAIGGAKVCVPAAQSEEAARILARDDSELLEGVAEGQAPPAVNEVCPRCGALTAEPSSLGFRSRALSLLVGLPFVFWRNLLHCSRCGHTWRQARRPAA